MRSDWRDGFWFLQNMSTALSIDDFTLDLHGFGEFTERDHQKCQNSLNVRFLKHSHGRPDEGRRGVAGLFFFLFLHQSVLWFGHLHCLLPNDSDLWSRGCSDLKSMIISWVLDTFNCLMPFVLVLIVLLIPFVLPTAYRISLLGNIKSSELSWHYFVG